MKVILTCISPEQADLLEEIDREYCKFKNLDELPDNVYQAFYWLSRYSGLVVRSPKENVEAETQPITQATCKPSDICQVCEGVGEFVNWLEGTHIECTDCKGSGKRQVA